jgi:uncharacterized BrkB/YihY/UPF0761 family membrane protein
MVFALGVVTANSSELKAELSAFLTWLVIFLINFAGYMVQFQAVPTADQLWMPFWQSLLTALVIYALNKGIQYTQKPQTPTSEPK